MAREEAFLYKDCSCKHMAVKETHWKAIKAKSRKRILHFFMANDFSCHGSQCTNANRKIFEFECVKGYKQCEVNIPVLGTG